MALPQDEHEGEGHAAAHHREADAFGGERRRLSDPPEGAPGDGTGRSRDEKRLAERDQILDRAMSEAMFRVRGPCRIDDGGEPPGRGDEVEHGIDKRGRDGKRAGDIARPELGRDEQYRHGNGSNAGREIQPVTHCVMLRIAGDGGRHERRRLIVGEGFGEDLCVSRQDDNRGSGRRFIAHEVGDLPASRLRDRRVSVSGSLRSLCILRITGQCLYFYRKSCCDILS